MSRGGLLQMLSYVMVSVVAVSAAFLVSLRFVARTHSQVPTPEGTVAGGNQKPDAKGGEPEKESAAAVATEIQGFLEPFIYDAKNRRDPFQAYADVRPVEAQPAFLSPLQKYDIDEFKLVGIMWDIRDPKAMFVDPERQVHVVGRDESIGKRNGYIATIRESEVVVVETFRNKDGTVSFKPKVLRMER